MKQLIYGARQIGGPPSYKSCDEVRAREVLEYAYTEGIKIYDTAPIYGMGQSEKLLGNTFVEVRKDIQIISKFGFDWDSSGKSLLDFSVDSIKRQLDDSLKRLKTDYIDMYFLHVPEASLNVEEVLGVLNSFKKQGVIKSYGVCNTYLKQLKSFVEHPLSQMEYIEDFYNILERKAENLIFPFKKTQKFFAYGPLFRGVMTSKTIKELLEGDEDGINRLIKNKSLPLLYKQKQIYEMVAKKKGVTIEQIAIDFLKKSENVDGVIIGTTQKKHLASFIEHFKKEE